MSELHRWAKGMKADQTSPELPSPISTHRASKGRRILVGSVGVGLGGLGFWLFASDALLPVVIAIWLLACLLVVAAALGRPAFLREAEEIGVSSLPPIG